MSIFGGRDGALRIFDSSAILHGAAPRDDAAPDIVTWDGAAAWANITSDVDTDDAAAASAFLADNSGMVFVGSDTMFAMIKYLKGAGSNYAAGSGAMIMYYFDGSDFSNQVSGLEDLTESGGDCFAQDGYIGFKIPSDWAVGANAVSANLDSDKYYVGIMTTDSPATDPDADVLCPCDGQYFDVMFAGMDFNGPLGRPPVEEMLKLNRAQADANMHYVKGADGKIMEAVPFSFSCWIDDSVNRERLQKALACGNPDDGARWTGVGVTSKGTTKNDGTNYNPAFADATHKTVNVQQLFSSSSLKLGFAYYESWFDPGTIKIEEGAEGVKLSASGGCYGVIETIHGFGNRY